MSAGKDWVFTHRDLLHQCSQGWIGPAFAGVERTLDELRPYLMADGGNVEVVEIDGPIVKVRLQGACGSCPSSTMTLKMGIERKLREAIPEVSEVVQVL
jgi:Fe-S cluster biogenesis protein NfuA